jgi:predicted phosphoribosyltransferase
VVLQVDDLIATGGTLRAGINLMGEQQAAETLYDVICQTAPAEQHCSHWGSCNKHACWQPEVTAATAGAGQL